MSRTATPALTHRGDDVIAKIELARAAPVAYDQERRFVRALVDALDAETRSLTTRWEVRRRSLERALHDGAQQQLLSLRLALTQAAVSGPAVRLERLREELVDRLDGVIEELLELARGGRPTDSVVDDLGAVIRDRLSDAPLTVTLDAPDGIVVDGVVAETLVFVAAELVTNTARHSGADTATVRLELVTDEVVLTVADRGRGGAAVTQAGGLHGLTRRVRGLGGEITVDSGAAGTAVSVTLPRHVDPSPRPAPVVVPIAPPGRPGRDVLADDLDDSELDVWTWCAVSGFRDEQGHRPPDLPARPRVRVDVGGQLFALVETTSAPDRVARAIDQRFEAVTEAQRRARTAVARHRVEAQRALLEQRRVAIDQLVSERLSRRSTEPLLRSRDLLIGGDGPVDMVERLHAASDLIGQATEELRLLVRRIREFDSDDTSTTVALGDVLELAARRAGVDATVAADELSDRSASAVVERVAEELMFAAGRRNRVRITVRRRGRTAVLRARLDRLPEPAVMSLIEVAVAGVGGRAAFRSDADNGVRVEVEVPCGS